MAVRKQKRLLFVMEVMVRVNLRFFLLLFVSLVSGCGSSMIEQGPCPHTAIIAELSKRIDASGVRTEMDSVHPVCQWVDNHLYVDMRLRLTSFRGTSKIFTFAPVYFVAILDENGNLLSRTRYQTEITFEPEDESAVTFQQVQALVNSEDCSVYIGFELDANQLRALEKERVEKAAGYSRR